MLLLLLLLCDTDLVVHLGELHDVRVRGHQLPGRPRPRAHAAGRSQQQPQRQRPRRSHHRRSEVARREDLKSMLQAG